ncbi:tail sheath [Cronobacter phage LPCS28]|uniref:Tail sheath stabilizer and completion protein n=1 Tax=Cronobacter phage LPCS28 TaxID=2924885 RepID=A0AAE9GAW2_9CAUD|nr:tail sheath [Cronobacter phage LPCS28]UNY47130.1 hypothetical protein EHEKIMEA_00248 [Cronobacter phage LPCS28]
MFGHFYNSSIRNYIVLLGELLGHVQVKRVREGKDKYIKVPISYVSKEHFVQKMTNAFNTAGDNPEKLAKINTILPRMSLQLVDVMYDETFKTGIQNRKTVAPNVKLHTQFNPVPYKFTFQVGIYTRYEDDMFQIIEQILPYFQPTFNCKIKELHENNVTIDRIVPVTVTSVILDEQLESDRLSQRRLEWTLTVEVQGWLYPAATKLEGEIRTIYINLFNNEKTLGENEAFESIDFQVDPEDVSPDDWDGSYITGVSENTNIPSGDEPPKPRGDLTNGKIER